MNKIMLIGRITRDLQLKNLGNTEVCNFALAVKRGGKNDETDFFECTGWGKTAELITTYCKKGERIAVEGSLRTNSYVNAESVKIVKTYVNITNITFIETKKEKKTSNTNIPELPDFLKEIAEDELPF